MTYNQVKYLFDELPKLQVKENKKISEELRIIKTQLHDSEEPVISEILKHITSQGLPDKLIGNLQFIDLEGRKDAVAILMALLHYKKGSRMRGVEYFETRPQSLDLLIEEYSCQETALHCGMMLREMSGYDRLTLPILTSPHFYNFFKYVEGSTFEIASDAFSTFQKVLTTHTAQASEFLEQYYDSFFTHYQSLLNSKNYVLRRKALQLLGKILIDRHNCENVLPRYASELENLELIMNSLREKSENIWFEAFNVLKLFVYFPNKPEPIRDILRRNREKLIDVITELSTARPDDEQFNDEKSFVINILKEL